MLSPTDSSFSLKRAGPGALTLLAISCQQALTLSNYYGCGGLGLQVNHALPWLRNQISSSTKAVSTNTKHEYRLSFSVRKTCVKRKSMSQRKQVEAFLLKIGSCNNHVGKMT